MRLNNLGVGALILTIGACTGVPSFYDDNESLLASNVVYSVKLIDCNKAPISFLSVDRTSDRLRTYAKLKGSNDVIELIDIFDKSLDPVLKREAMSSKYCELKKETLIKQSSKMAQAIMGRFQ